MDFLKLGSKRGVRGMDDSHCLSHENPQAGGLALYRCEVQKELLELFVLRIKLDVPSRPHVCEVYVHILTLEGQRLLAFLERYVEQRGLGLQSSPDVAEEVLNEVLADN